MVILVQKLDDLLYFARADAGRADVTGLGFTVQFNRDLLQVGQPAALGGIVGVTDAVAGHRPLITHHTFSAHCIDLPKIFT